MDKAKALEIKKEGARRKARTTLKDFTEYTTSEFDWQPYHKAYYEILDRFAKGKIKKLMVSMPPQHGKSEGSTRRLPSFMFGLNPDTRLAVTSYNATIARKFNRDNQRIIDTPEYAALFPNTRLNSSNVVTVASSYLRNSEEFEIVGHKGMLKAVGRGGALTSITLDCVIMDDLYKDYQEGSSPVIRESAWDWYTSVVKTRLHNNSQQLIVFTRWHEEDVIGRIEENEKVNVINDLRELDEVNPNEWIKINFEAIKMTEATPIDQRKKGEALWDNRHSISKLEEERRIDPNKFECLHQGNPTSKEGLLYSGEWRTYDKIPENVTKKGNYTDTADAGADYLCSICYDRVGDDIYVTDILYTLDGMESTEVMMPRMLNDAGTRIANVESNNGGRYFAINIQKQTKCVISWFHQSLNKEARIVSNSAQVQRHILFPKDWHSRWGMFWKHLTGFKKNFRANTQDGAPDVLTGIIEKNIVFKNPTQPNYETEHTRFVKGDSTGFNASPWNADRKSTSGDFF
jgi:predicted phage terminase large subunit-like protein